MRVGTPVTDVIRQSILTTQGDLVVRGATDVERLAAGVLGTYLQGKGAGVLPAYDNQMPPLTTLGDLLVRGVVIPERLPDVVVGRYLQSKGVGVKPAYDNQMPPLTTKGDLIVQGAAIPERIPSDWINSYLKGAGIGEIPVYRALALKDTGIKIGVFAINGSGNYVISNVGFQPSVVFFIASDDIDTQLNMSWGFDDGTTHFCLYTKVNLTSQLISSTYSIFVYRASSPQVYGAITALNGAGFTVTITQVGGMQSNCFYLALP